jgi:hypothetical protein
MQAKAVERASAIVAVGAIAMIPQNRRVLSPILESKRWWWRKEVFVSI